MTFNLLRYYHDLTIGLVRVIRRMIGENLCPFVARNRLEVFFFCPHSRGAGEPMMGGATASCGLR